MPREQIISPEQLITILRAIHDDCALNADRCASANFWYSQGIPKYSLTSFWHTAKEDLDSLLRTLTTHW